MNTEQATRSKSLSIMKFVISLRRPHDLLAVRVVAVIAAMLVLAGVGQAQTPLRSSVTRQASRCQWDSSRIQPTATCSM